VRLQLSSRKIPDLMRHTAGLVYGQFGDALIHKEYRAQNMMDRGQSLPEMITKLSRLPLAHQPGEVWEYSMATDVLGRVVEVVSGATLDAFIEERITKPLKMASTAFWVQSPDQNRVAEPAGGSRDRQTTTNARSDREAALAIWGRWPRIDCRRLS
jgi:CubicO group peptidase (beta-lactamase class C family)